MSVKEKINYGSKVEYNGEIAIVKRGDSPIIIRQGVGTMTWDNYSYEGIWFNDKARTSDGIQARISYTDKSNNITIKQMYIWDDKKLILLDRINPEIIDLIQYNLIPPDSEYSPPDMPGTTQPIPIPTQSKKEREWGGGFKSRKQKKRRKRTRRRKLIR